MELVQCIYCSAAQPPDLNEAELALILEAARSNNAQLQVTGMLLFQEGSFFQVLEGDRDTVEKLYKHIAGDKRHAQVKRLIVEPIEERHFGEWTMGYPQISRKDLASIPGLNDFFSQGQSFNELGEGRAKLLLDAFRQGQWRSSLDG